MTKIPRDWDLVYRQLSYSWRHIVYLCREGLLLQYFVVDRSWIILTARFIRGASDTASSSFWFLSLFSHICCCIEVHNVTSRAILAARWPGQIWRQIARILKAKKVLYRFFQHFLSFETFSIDIQLQETRKKKFRVICTLSDLALRDAQLIRSWR